MKVRSGLCLSKGLASGPAIFVPLVCVLVLPSQAMSQGKSGIGAVHGEVSLAEARLTKALTAQDSAALSRIGMGLGSIIESALARRENGGEVTACEMAAHSLAFVAVSAADGLISKGEARALLMGDAMSAASDFQNDMQACDREAGKGPGSHAGLGKALRAL